MEQSQEDAGRLKNLRSDRFQETLLVWGYLACGFQSWMSFAPATGAAAKMTQAAPATMSINAGDVVSQTFCLRI